MVIEAMPIFAKELDITWGNDTKIWNFEGSSSDEHQYAKLVGSSVVVASKRVDSVEAGSYTVKFTLRVDSAAQNSIKVKLFVHTADMKTCLITDDKLLNPSNNWDNIQSAEFALSEPESLYFCLVSVNKDLVTGLLIDSAVITPVS